MLTWAPPDFIQLMVSWGKKQKLGVKGKNEKRERKKEENYIKKGGKGLKKCIFLGYNSKNLSGNKINLKKKGGGEMIKLHNIYPWPHKIVTWSI